MIKQIEDTDTEDSLSEETEEVDEKPSSSTEQPNLILESDLILEPLRSKLTIISLLLIFLTSTWMFSTFLV